MTSMLQMSPVIGGTLSLLPVSDQPELMQASLQLYYTLASTHSNAVFTSATTVTTGWLSGWLATSCLFTYWAAVMQVTVVEQLYGSRTLGDQS